MTDELLATAEETVARALKEGATDAEAYVCRVRGLTLDRLGRLAYARELHESGIALRVTVGRRFASATASATSGRGVDKAVSEAMRRARAKPEAKDLPAYAEPGPLGPPTRVDARLAALDEDSISADAAAVSDLLATGDPDVTFHSTNLWTYAQDFAVANSRGVAAWDQDAMQILQAEARVTRAGVSRTARETVCVDRPVRDAIDVEEMARRAVERAAFATGARPLPRPVDEVIFAPVPAGQLLHTWLPSVAGAADAPRAHPRAKPAGAQVASKVLTLLDAPRGGESGPRHQRMDDEGTPTRDATLVDAGVLQYRMLNASAAAVAGERSTGNAYRGLLGRCGSKATIRPGNLQVKPGSKSLDELIAGMDRGVVLTDQLMGAFIANTTTGDFSYVASTSLYVERGSVAHALPSVTLGGDAHEVLQRVLAVGRDARSVVHGKLPHIHATGVACAT